MSTLCNEKWTYVQETDNNNLFLCFFTRSMFEIYNRNVDIISVAARCYLIPCMSILTQTSDNVRPKYERILYIQYIRVRYIGIQAYAETLN